MLQMEATVHKSLTVLHIGVPLLDICDCLVVLHMTGRRMENQTQYKCYLGVKVNGPILSG